MQHERQLPNPSRIQIAKDKIGGLPTTCLQAPTLSSERERERDQITDNTGFHGDQL
jgi:hypothetical protein